MTSAPNVLFVGLGSPHGDDQIGWHIADGLRHRLTERSEAEIGVRKAAAPLDILDWLGGVERMHICDACRSDEAPGTIYRLEAVPLRTFSTASVILPELQQLRGGGSHDFSLAAVLELASRLGRLPSHLIVHAVNGERFELGEPLSSELLGIGSQLISTILEELINARSLTRAIAPESG